MDNHNDIPTNIGRPVRRALGSVGIVRMHQLEKVAEAELLKLHGFGPKALQILREALETTGRSFKTDKA